MNKFSFLAIQFFVLVLGSLPSLAEDNTNWLELDLQTTEKPSEASGIILDDKGARVTKQITINTNSENQTVVAIPYTVKSDSTARYAFVAAKTEQGQMLYSAVRQIGQGLSDSSIFSLARCTQEKVDPVMQSQLSLISNLMELRIKRRANFQSKTKQVLSGEFLDKMRRYEEGFGLTRSSALSSDLTPFELVDRLDRILHTLRKISSPS